MICLMKKTVLEIKIIISSNIGFNTNPNTQEQSKIYLKWNTHVSLRVCHKISLTYPKWHKFSAPKICHLGYVYCIIILHYIRPAFVRYCVDTSNILNSIRNIIYDFIGICNEEIINASTITLLIIQLGVRNLMSSELLSLVLLLNYLHIR